ncbi:MAG: beta-ketoacyl-ACP synthase II [Chloroflexi bacterium]|nr:beta-ketoacyl-ACP synthase II [Chloroflexota bacterium]
MSGRVVITGVGAISPLGLDFPTTWEAVLAGKSGVDHITLFDASQHQSKIAGEVKGFEPENYMDRKEARRMDRFMQLAVVAAGEALRDAGLKIDASNAEDVGVFFGSGIGGITTLSQQFKVLAEKGPNRLSPFLSTMFIGNMAAGQVGISFGAKGPNLCTTTACASGGHAIGEAFETIRRGAAKAAIAGGAEAAVTAISVGAFNAMNALSTRNDEPAKASRPFDALRDGFIVAEGAAALILEDYDFAVRRGARVLAEMVGYGASADAFHVTAPPEGGAGAVQAMRRALQEAGLLPEEISYINAHGTSTQLNDKAETLAIKAVFGESAQRIPVSSTKSMTGHLIGAAGAMEAAFCVATINANVVPPTINQENPDPDCDLDYVPNVARRQQVDVALSNSLGFGGHNSTLIVKRFE